MSEFLGGPKETLETLTAAASKNLCQVVVPKHDELQIDLDTPASIEQYNRMMAGFKDQLKLEEIDSWASKSGNRHVIVRFPKTLSSEMRIALQACLGSDPKREILSLMRVMSGSKYTSVLFKPIFTPDKAPTTPEPDFFDRLQDLTM
jgi:hypothetical protein